MTDSPARDAKGGQYATRPYAAGIPSAIDGAGSAGEEMQLDSLAQSTEMPLHGTCFIGAGVAWSFMAIFAQQSPVEVCAASPQDDAIKRADGIA